jgi:hypothetical protein
MVVLGLSVTHLPDGYALTAAAPARRAGRLARRRRALDDDGSAQAFLA